MQDAAQPDGAVDGAAVIQPLTLRVCVGLSCEMAGAGDLMRRLPGLLGGSEAVVPVACLGRCDQARALLVGQVAVPCATEEAVVNAVVTERMRPPGAQGMAEPATDFIGYEDYLADGGYCLAASIANGERDAQAVLRSIEESGLCDAGGARSAAAHWRAIRDVAAPRVITVDIGAAAAGNFTDRYYLERDPHRLLEGALIAARVTGAQSVAICLRVDYYECRLMLENELAHLRDSPPCPLPQIELRRGGLDAGSTVLRCESLRWVREILEKGPRWFAGFGRNGRKGLHSFSVSGRVSQPGVKLAPAGITPHELIEEYCGGMAEGQDLLMPPALANAPLDDDTLVVLGRQDPGSATAGGTDGPDPVQ